MSNLIFINAAKNDVVGDCLKLQSGTNYTDSVYRDTAYAGQTPKSIKVVNSCSTGFTLPATTLFTDTLNSGSFVATTVSTVIPPMSTVDVMVSYTGTMKNVASSRTYPIVLNGSAADYTLTIITPDSPPTTEDNTISLPNRTNTTVTKSSLLFADINGNDSVTGARFTGDVSKLFTDTGRTVPYVAGTELVMDTFVLYYKYPEQDAASTYVVTYNVKADGVWST